MPSFVIPILVLSAPALALALFRRTWWWPALLWILGMIVGQVMGWLEISDWFTLFGDTVLLNDGRVIAIWLVWCIVANAALNTHTLPASIGPTTGGMCSTMTMPTEQNEINTKNAFIVMSTSLLHPGTMIGGLYFFTDTFAWLWLWLLAVFYLVLGTENLVSEKSVEKGLELNKLLFPSKWHGIAGFILGAAFLLSEWSLGLLLCTLPVWCWKARTSFPWQTLLYVGGSFACVNLAVGAGLPEVSAWGLEELPMDIHFVLPIFLLCTTTLLSTIVGSIPMTFFGVALFERLMDLPSIGLSIEPLLAIYGIGLVIGNIRPLIWYETVHSNLWQWCCANFVMVNLLAFLLYNFF